MEKALRAIIHQSCSVLQVAGLKAGYPGRAAGLNLENRLAAGLNFYNGEMKILCILYKRPALI